MAWKLAGENRERAGAGGNGKRATARRLSRRRIRHVRSQIIAKSIFQYREWERERWRPPRAPWRVYICKSVFVRQAVWKRICMRRTWLDRLTWNTIASCSICGRSLKVMLISWMNFSRGKKLAESLSNWSMKSYRTKYVPETKEKRLGVRDTAVQSTLLVCDDNHTNLYSLKILLYYIKGAHTIWCISFTWVILQVLINFSS